MRKRAQDAFDAAFEENGRDYDRLKFVRSFGLARRDVVAGRRDADILLENTLERGVHPEVGQW